MKECVFTLDYTLFLKEISSFSDLKRGADKDVRAKYVHANCCPIKAARQKLANCWKWTPYKIINLQTDIKKKENTIKGF